MGLINFIIVGPSQASQMLLVAQAIVSELIQAQDKGISVNLNDIRMKQCKKHKLTGLPKLVDIISAIPDEHKKTLLPMLKARPIRSASGVKFFPSLIYLFGTKLFNF